MDALMDTRDNLTGLLTGLRATGLFRQLALRFGEGLLVLSEEARVRDVLTIGQRGKRLQSNVNTDLLIGRRQEFRHIFNAEAGELLAVDSADGAGLDVSVNQAM